MVILRDKTFTDIAPPHGGQLSFLFPISYRVLQTYEDDSTVHKDHLHLHFYILIWCYWSSSIPIYPYIPQFILFTFTYAYLPLIILIYAYLCLFIFIYFYIPFYILIYPYLHLSVLILLYLSLIILIYLYLPLSTHIYPLFNKSIHPISEGSSLAGLISKYRLHFLFFICRGEGVIDMQCM